MRSPDRSTVISRYSALRAASPAELCRPWPVEYCGERRRATGRQSSRDYGYAAHGFGLLRPQREGATDMFRAGVPLERVQQFLGRASIETTVFRSEGAMSGRR